MLYLCRAAVKHGRENKDRANRVNLLCYVTQSIYQVVHDDKNPMQIKDSFNWRHVRLLYAFWKLDGCSSVPLRDSDNDNVYERSL